MEWTRSLKKAINFIENHILDDIDGDIVAKEVHASSFYFQKIFSYITGFTVSEYIRFRRLYLAALELLSSEIKVIDLAYKYGYETPESFTKAFTRFHGISPSSLRTGKKNVKTFLPLKISISISGGEKMDCRIETMDKIVLIGLSKYFCNETSYKDVPNFWDEFCKKFESKKYSEEIINVINKCKIGQFAVCIDDEKFQKHFRYLIAGIYDGGIIPEGLELFTISSNQWAKFRCSGPLPGALQTVNTEIFKNWLPDNPDWEMSEQLNIEWYSPDNNCENEIWLPVKARK